MTMERLISIPFSFFDAKKISLTNHVIGDTVLSSQKIPEGFTGIIKDNDTIFLTSGGSFDYVILRASGGKSTFRQNVSNDDSGFINKILREGDRILIVLKTAGVGVVDLVWDGELKQVRKIESSNALDEIEDDEL